MDQKKHSHVTLSDSSFQHEVLENEKPVLVDFSAPWYGPRQVMGPMINELAEEFQSRATVAKLNVDDHQQVAARYGIQSIPTLMLFRNGRVVDQVVGTVPKTVLAQRLTNLVQAA